GGGGAVRGLRAADPREPGVPRPRRRRRPFRKAWEAIVDLGAKLFENREADQVATQVPLSGELENPDAGLLPAIVNLARNAFVAAFAHSLEGSIDFDDVAPAARCLGDEAEAACEKDDVERTERERGGAERSDGAEDKDDRDNDEPDKGDR